MQTMPSERLTAHEYLAREQDAAEKSEFYDGEVFAMAGASPRHGEIAANMLAAFVPALRPKNCKAYGSDLRVWIPETHAYCYPDVVVVCGRIETSPDDSNAVANPRLIVEVLSESTADWDRGGKFEHYRTIPSLLEYLVVAQDRVHVEHYSRQPNGTWLLTETNRLEDTLALPSLDIELKASDVYDRVDLSGSATVAIPAR